MTGDEPAAQFHAQAAHYRLAAEEATDPDLVTLYRLVAEGLENVAIALKADSEADS